MAGILELLGLRRARGGGEEKSAAPGITTAPETTTRNVETEQAQKARPREFKLALGETNQLGAFLIGASQLGAGTPASALALYEQSSAVSSIIDMIVDPFVEMTPILVDKRTGEQIEDAPALERLYDPSPDFSREVLFNSLATNYLVTGECYSVAVGNVASEPVWLEPMTPKNIALVEGFDGRKISIDVSGNTLAGAYMRTTTEKGRVRFLRDDLTEIWQTRTFSTRNNSLLGGQAPLLSAANDARQHILGGRHNVSVLEKGGHVSLVFHTDAELSPEMHDQWKADIRKQYGGASEAGQIGATSGGNLSIHNLGASQKDMDWANMMSMVKQAFALRYHVPLPLVTLDASTFNNFAQALLALYDYAVIPLAGIIYGSLSWFLLPRYGIDPLLYEYTFDPDHITALVMRRHEELQKRAKAMLETTNELRSEMRGRPDVDGGDEIMVSGTLIPLSQAAAEPEPVPDPLAMDFDRDDDARDDDE